MARRNRESGWMRKGALILLILTLLERILAVVEKILDIINAGR